MKGQTAKFSLATFSIKKFQYNEVNGEGVSIEFKPKGTYYRETGRFEVELDFVAKSDISPKLTVCKANMVAIFEFDEKIPGNELPDFFFVNSIAIIFPYLRAFISTLTLQANSHMIVLPLLNLVEVGKVLKKKICRTII